MTQKCPDCDGRGKIPHCDDENQRCKIEKCKRCNGTGEIEAECATIDISQIPVPDKILHEIFKKQAELQVKVVKEISTKNSAVDLIYGRPSFVPVGIVNASMREREYFTKENVVYIIDECTEILGWINWKPWKRTRKDVNIEEVKFEIIDVLHFWVNLCLIWGITPDDVYRYYFHKQKINIKRQDDKY